MAGSASSIYYNYDGTVLRLGRGFIGSEGIQYPSNWLGITTDEDKLAIGITIGAAPPTLTFDSRFWIGFGTDGNLIARQFADVGVGTATTEGIRTRFKVQEVQNAVNTLSGTGWLIIRNTEFGDAIPVGVTSYRSEVISVGQSRVGMISATTDNGMLESLITGAGTSSIPGYTTTFLPNYPNPEDYYYERDIEL